MGERDTVIGVKCRCERYATLRAPAGRDPGQNAALAR